MILPNTPREDWPGLRQEIHARILATMGQEPVTPRPTTATVRDRLTRHGLAHEEIEFEVLPGVWGRGTFVLPDGDHASCPGAICIHGTNVAMGRRSMIDPQSKPNSAYGIELARRGYVILTVDQYGFGDWVSEERTQADLHQEFRRAHPDWSLDGMRLRVQRCAVDLLASHPRVDAARLAAIGNSLGGRAVIYLAAFDERIQAAICSTGISPNVTNVFRNPAAGDAQLSPALNAAIHRDGRTPWEYQELMALVAPRALLLLEPFNDNCNPYVEPTVACFLRARRVWEILEQPDRVALLCHGWGHGTIDSMRTYAYDVLDLWLAPKD